MNASDAAVVPDKTYPKEGPGPRERRFLALVGNLWFWLALIVLVISGLMFNWVHQSRSARIELQSTIHAMLHSNRAELAKLWHVRLYRPYHFTAEWIDRLTWDPDATAPATMAITPRGPLNESDAIYMLYHGEQPAALFALTSSGAYVNELEVNLNKYPKLLLERQLTPEELAQLTELAAFIRTRRDRNNAQSQQYIWCDQVLKTLLDIKLAQTGGMAKLN